MNGTMQWLRGTLVTLSLVLAAASVGCVTNPDESESDFDQEESGVASQELGEIAEPPPNDEEEVASAPSLDEGSVDDGDGGEPQPVPWITRLSSPLPDDPVDPLNPAKGGAPSGTHGSGK